jgi:hypothetical protein
MADITKCKGTHCNRKEQCYRYTAKENEYRQAYFTIVPVNDVQDCDYFWKDENETVR